ncbi:amidohydrolase family protein [Pseudonocardia kunmingensis]|uniref:Amidohydrolase family protein n=1 Tax=Pseudonocardia kunmingensis TaxID=630975 RepID=A0A543D3A6_9PSEU|nr:amidohydrolase family protein [Pseudonocardia kunmingensis]TQM03825.1 amidohydrolase family protein [Pseudonocardia kunmingensis]
MAAAWVLDDVILVDGTGGAPVPRSRVVVEDGVIVSVGSAATPPVAGAAVVEGRGRWVLPGLWDTHMHHRFSAGGMLWPEEFREEQLLLNWRAYLAAGVTSVVSIGDDPTTTVAARAAEQDGALVGPRVFAAGSLFTAPGGHPVGTVLRNPAVRVGDLAIEVGHPVEARRRLRLQCEQHGIDLVKVVYSSIPGGGPRLGREVLDALVEEARLLGRRVFAHVSTFEEAAECVQAGVDGLEHMVVKRGTPFDPAELRVG